MSLLLSTFLVLPQISLVKYYETIKILMQIFLYFKLHFDNDACPWQKNYFEVFFLPQSNLLVCRISTLSDNSNRFFANKYHIFCKYLFGIFFLTNFWEFFTSQKWNYQIWVKIEQKLALYFYKFLKALIVWIAA